MVPCSESLMFESVVGSLGVIYKDIMGEIQSLVIDRESPGFVVTANIH